MATGRKRQLSLFGPEQPARRGRSGVGPAAVTAELEALARKLPSNVLLGTSSWSFPGWKGLVYDGEASYPDMAPGAQGSSASPHYEVTLQPGAACGQIVGTTMSITGAGFEAGSAFTIPVGRYESSISSTDTPVAIPREGTVYSYINVADSFPFEEVDAEVHILHDDISELELLLSAPNPSPEERPVYLHSQTGAGVANIDTISAFVLPLLS